MGLVYVPVYERRNVANGLSLSKVSQLSSTSSGHNDLEKKHQSFDNLFVYIDSICTRKIHLEEVTCLCNLASILL